MEAIMAASTIEGGVLKTPAQVVAEVLPKTTFLRNAELKTKGRSIKSVAAAAARVEELESELDAERQATLDLKKKTRTHGEANGGFRINKAERNGTS
ncbi:hypothetical protein PR202_gb20326 [Eleusine coracana subsp. coracana]|uniref:Uncharacterized protein n=1 Tax=Eleusine coracana subsp. coracana TaxID=191504 RepID=A0AAV5FAE0_ELECO|nr:hypothetical protein PR202_gb20326 [Eleusine coracana subsp. coracana]